MWIMTTLEFFSAVQKPGDDQLTIRARVRSDLEALAKTLPELGPIQQGGGTDYPYRARVPHAAFALALARLSHDIDYANFKNAVAERQGAARAKAYGKVWEVLYGLAPHATAASREPLAASKTASHGPAPSGMNLAYGGVVVDAEGRVLLREPKGHYGGYVWTFPKGRQDRGETPTEAALREVCEESGQVAEIVSAIPGWFRGDTSATAFYLMRPVTDVGFAADETSAVRWVSFDGAGEYLGQTTSQAGRKRDLAVLAAAREVWEGRR